MRKHLMILAAILAGLALVAAGCGGDDNNDSGSSGSGSSSSQDKTTDTTESTPTAGGGAAQDLKLTADPTGALKFDKKTLAAKPGKVTITMDNPSPVPHAVEVEGNGVEKASKTLTQGKASVTVDVKAGKYEFYCPVDGHKQAGMKGTLTVG